VRIVALAQGGADHYLRGRRGVWDLDVIVCFAHNSALPRLWRRMVRSWDWGTSKLGRGPYDPPEYIGRAVDIAFWVIPDRPDPVAALREWLADRAAKHANPNRRPDLAHEPSSSSGPISDRSPGIRPTCRRRGRRHTGTAGRRAWRPTSVTTRSQSGGDSAYWLACSPHVKA
jgi:hypothetical protein